MKEHAEYFHLRLMAYKGTVYDVSKLLFQHPGGYDTLKPFLNDSVDDIIFNEKHYKHHPIVLWKL